MECAKSDNNMEIDNDSCEETAKVAEDVGDSPMKRVLNLPELRHHIFMFLPLTTIKNCRLVCHEWNVTAEPILLKISYIVFSNNLSPEDAKLPDKFIDDFQTSSLLKKCDKFCFNSPECSIDFDDLDNFIGQFGEDMKELTIFRINIRCALYALRQKDLINLIPANLTKLNVVCENVNHQLTIRMDRLKNIKSLLLGECILKIVKNVMVAPVELQLKNVYFSENRNDYLERVKFNNLFDFSNLQILRLNCNDTKNVELDVGGSFNLKLLILENVKVLNWESSKWTVKQLTLGKKMKFVTSTNMKFDELDFGGPIIDAALLPTTLKKLTIRKSKTKIQNIEFAKNFVELKYLILQRRNFTLLTNFHRCPKLTHLHLAPESDDDDLTTIDISLIPKTLKVFRLSYDCELSGSADFQLETVITENVGFLKAFGIAIEHFKTKNAFLYCSNFKFAPPIDNGMADLMADFQNFIVGPFLPPRESNLEFFFWNFEENPKADYLMKNAYYGGDAKERQVDKIEIQRIKDARWTNESIEMSF